MRRAVRGSWLFLFGPIFLGPGCGSELPPRPVLKLNTGSIPAPEGSAKAVFMVIPGEPDEDMEFWGIAGQREAGDARAVFRVMGPGPSVPSLTQADVVRKAVADGASALVVVAGNEPGLPAALAEAQAKQVPVILMGKPVDPPAGAAAFTRVVPGSFEPAARKVVAYAQADAKQLGRSGTASAIILVDTLGDLYSSARVAALKGAAEAAGIKKVELLPFKGGMENAKNAVLKAVKDDPEVAIVLCDDDPAMLGASRARMELERNPIILVGGFAGSKGLWDPNYYVQESSFVECRNEQLAKLAVWTALARARGEVVAPVMELEPKFSRGRGADTPMWRVPGPGMEETNPEKRAGNP